MTDFTSGYTTLKVKQWRGLVYDYSAMENGIGSGSKLYCLTNFQAMFLQQNVDYMRWVTRWANLTITREELGQHANDLELALMTCCAIEPWQINFIYNQNVIEILISYNELYDLGGIPELNENTPIDFFNGDDSDNRNDALCTATAIYVRSYSANWITKAEIVLGVTVGLAVVASISIVGGVIAGTLLAGLALITQTALDAFNDDDAINDVICCMTSGLSGLVVSEANFQTSLDSCSFGIGTNQAIIRDIIASDLFQWDNYLSFLNSLGDAFLLAENGVVVCNCDVGWSHTFDFTVDDGGFIDNVFVATVGGNYIPGSGWSYKDTFISAGHYWRSISVKKEFISSDITEVSMTYDYLQGADWNANSTASWVESKDGVTQQGYISESRDVIVDGIGEQLTLNAVVNSDEITLFLASSRRASNTYGGDCLITSVTVKGTGLNPF